MNVCAISDDAKRDNMSERPKRRPRYQGRNPRRYEEKYKELQPEAYLEMQEHIRAQGKTPAGTHVSVMMAEVMEALRPAAGDVVADCTLGYGGHALEFMERIGPAGRLIGFDVDAAQLERTRERLMKRGSGPFCPEDPNGRSGERRPRADAARRKMDLTPFSLHRSSFAGIGKALAEEKLEGYDVIFADLGVSSMQVDDPARGFSYKYDGPLDMRMDDRIRQTAADLVNTMSAEDLSAALLDLSDEPDHGVVAQRIVSARARKPIRSTGELVRVVFAAKDISFRGWREQVESGEHGYVRHPAALTFQALRMLVNDEIGALKQLLRMTPYCLRPGGRVGIISFHSGEDRLVKHAFREGVQSGVYAEACDEPIRPSAQEKGENPRCVSAKLRWARRA
jgi:16S rRNA (cytosine1402-N4)-methyltransferase